MALYLDEMRCYLHGDIPAHGGIGGGSIPGGSGIPGGGGGGGNSEFPGPRAVGIAE